MPTLDLTSIRPDLTGTADLVVGPEHTAPRLRWIAAEPLLAAR